MTAQAPRYVRVDERDDVLVSLEVCDLLLPLVAERPQQWKWVLISAHSALQGSMVCALSGTAGIGALDERSARAMLDYLQERDPAKEIPEERLADFGVLLRRALDPEPMQHLGGSPLVLTTEQLDDLKKLHSELRNKFIHFTPKGWSIEEAGLPRIVGAAIDATEQLMAHPASSLHLTPAQRTNLQSTIKSIRTLLTNA